MSERKYFGTDGIRGCVGTWPVTAEFMLKLGRAAGRVLAVDGAAKVLIGKDTRISGYMFEAALEAGLVAAGANVRLLGPMPTPAVAYLTRSLRGSAGIVISASHNPHQDNGVKFFSAAGEKLSDAVELAIERELEQPFTTVASERIGKAVRVDDAAARYAEFCKSTVDAELSLSGVSLVLDCAHGATYQIAPRLFAELGAELETMGNQPDGLNINRDCGSMHLEPLRRLVQSKTGRAIGIAFDGDGDRMLMIDEQGAIVDGDEVLFIIARDWAARGLLRGPVVGTLMSNFGLQRALAELDIPFLRAKVGDRYVHQMLKERGGMLGGEASGHLLCLNKASTGDGIVSALQVLEIMRRSGKALAELRAGMRKVPQTTLNVAIKPGSRPTEQATVQAALSAVENALADRGRVVLRPSGTEPVVRVTVEADDAQLVDRLVSELAEAVRSAA